MADVRKYTKPTDDRILTDRAELNKKVDDTLANLGGLDDGTFAKVDAIPTSVAVRDAYGRLKATHAITGKTSNNDDFVINVGLLNERLVALKNSLSDIYITKEETAAEIQKVLDELIKQIGNLDINYIMTATKRIDDHIAVTDRPHGATPILFPGSIPFRDGFGQFDVGEPQKDSNVARYDTIVKYLEGVDLDYLRSIKEVVAAIEDILINSLILWEHVEWQEEELPDLEPEEPEEPEEP